MPIRMRPAQRMRISRSACGLRAGCRAAWRARASCSRRARAASGDLSGCAWRAARPGRRHHERSHRTRAPMTAARQNSAGHAAAHLDDMHLAEGIGAVAMDRAVLPRREHTPRSCARACRREYRPRVVSTTRSARPSRATISRERSRPTKALCVMMARPPGARCWASPSRNGSSRRGRRGRRRSRSASGPADGAVAPSGSAAGWPRSGRSGVRRPATTYRRGGTPATSPWPSRPAAACPRRRVLLDVDAAEGGGAQRAQRRQHDAAARADLEHRWRRAPQPASACSTWISAAVYSLGRKRPRSRDRGSVGPASI